MPRDAGARECAAHGGRAELVAVEQGTAYLRLGGGCQGCAMATVTLSQGIERAIIQALPEITSVVDVTDHQTTSRPRRSRGGQRHGAGDEAVALREGRAGEDDVLASSVHGHAAACGRRCRAAPEWLSPTGSPRWRRTGS
jgi:Fe-S cluster biogenesis protein NfuA